MSRQNTCGLIIGRRGCGKSSYLLALIRLYLYKQDKAIIIYDTDDNDIYQAIPTIDIDYIPALKKGLYKCIDVDYKRFIKVMRWECSNKLIILEDATKYLQYAFEDVYNTALATKQRNNDLLLTFHSFRKVRPDFFEVANILTIFKTGEQWNNFKYKLPQPHLIKPVFELVAQHPSPFFNRSIKIN